MTNLFGLGIIADLIRKSRPLSQPAPQPAALPFVLHDIRDIAAQTHAHTKDRPQGWPTRGRSWTETTGICLHQTACVLGTRPERYRTLGAHIGIPRDGSVVWVHAFNRRVVAAQGFTDQTVSIEVDGLFVGKRGGKVWDNPATPQVETPNTPTTAQLETLQNVIRWIHADVAAHGGRVKALVAHRQSSGDRRDDPGPEIWAAALPMMAELELSDGGIGFKIGTGRAIPEDWDPRCKGIPY